MGLPSEIWSERIKSLPEREVATLGDPDLDLPSEIWSERTKSRLGRDLAELGEADLVLPSDGWAKTTKLLLDSDLGEVNVRLSSEIWLGPFMSPVPLRGFGEVEFVRC